MNPDPENQGGTPRMDTKVHIPQYLVSLLFHKSILGYLICDAFGKDTVHCLFYGISWEIRMMFIVIQQFFFFAKHKYIQKKKVGEMHSIFQLEDVKSLASGNT